MQYSIDLQAQRLDIPQETFFYSMSVSELTNNLICYVAYDDETKTYSYFDVTQSLMTIDENKKETYNAIVDSVIADYHTQFDSSSLDRAKSRKLLDLAKASIFEQYTNSQVFFKSSLGYSFNGDMRSKENLSTILTYDTDYAVRDLDNVNRTLTKEQIELLIKELSLNIQNLMNQKFAYASSINDAETREELDAIAFEFSMTDFTTPIE